MEIKEEVEEFPGNLTAPLPPPSPPPVDSLPPQTPSTLTLLVFHLYEDSRATFKTLRRGNNCAAQRGALPNYNSTLKTQSLRRKLFRSRAVAMGEDREDNSDENDDVNGYETHARGIEVERPWTTLRRIPKASC
ncbi:hypothetical protein HZH66_000823 [Vespula vulgaris]|uniref:Uncharacterized protein n=1 Tax=Vespula vulgaris TaxID=7454 RepID=A0A834KTU1_VESVU|nr:hypothetical protein HZH66_000823 [Vespula vulgaris]